MIYLDYSANTPVDEAVLQRFCEVERNCPGNANSRHAAGTAAKAAIDAATQSIARSLNVQPAEIIYTSGASEANNFAIKSIARLERHHGKHIISTPLYAMSFDKISFQSSSIKRLVSSGKVI